MKISELWLREIVNPALSTAELVSQLTMAGLEVDSVHPVAGEFTNVVVAQVETTAPHPQADKLTLCKVNAGTGQLLNIVCGAANVRKGLMVALALPGSQIPGGIVIKETKLRGEPSQGMLCSARELGLEEQSEGILELPADAPIGTDLRTYLHLDDSVLDIDLTPNRADCLSVLGIAREVAALNTMPLPPVAFVAQEPAIDEVVSVKLQADAACPRYHGRLIRAINRDATTPYWMKERLRRSGIRTLQPAVDVLNYVMLELGQPMHVFDASRIQGELQVRLAQANEKLTVLDGQTLILQEQVSVIADAVQPLALAGIIGGQESAVNEETVDIFLESAFFEPQAIAHAARYYHLVTDSSQRFERGVDPSLALQAMERATALLLEIVGGKPGPVFTIENPAKLLSIAPIAFSPARVKKITGVDIAEATMKVFLQRLGMEVQEIQDQWLITVPSYRFDLRLEVDLIEEIIRLNGFHAIAETPIVAPIQAGAIDPVESLQQNMSLFLCSRGYQETISYSFVDPAIQQMLYPNEEGFHLLNPISPELATMRIGMWPGLLASMIYNLNRQRHVIKLFETGSVFQKKNGVVTEQACFAGLITGEQGDLNWSELKKNFDFFDLKGDLEALFTYLNVVQMQFQPGAHPALHPGQTAKLMIHDKQVGWVGALHPRLLEELDYPREVLVFELQLAALLHVHPVRYQPISKYPQIRRDLSLLVKESVSVAVIEALVRGIAPKEWLKSFNVFDVYQGEPIPPGKKSIAIALTLQDDSRTLVDEEINSVISAIITKLDDEFGIILRD